MLIYFQEKLGTVLLIRFHEIGVKVSCLGTYSFSMSLYPYFR